jgi:pyruvate dehydrogenase E2 component (dihydrolipoamide acetyltransferase)
MRRDVEAFQAGGAAAVPAAARAVEREAGPAPVDPEDWTRTPLRGLRRTIAERMTHARHTAAHFTYVEEVDVTRLMERISGAGSGISPLAFIAHAAVRALAGYPVLNASIDDARGEIVMKGHVHLGIATATKQGLIVPVVRDAAQLGVADLAARIAKLAEGAREGSLGPGDLRGSTFTITSLGKLGGIVSTPILNHPEVAILGVNAIRRQPRVIDDAIVIRSVMNLSISVDHRIADGVVAAQYVGEVKRILEEMEFDER